MKIKAIYDDNYEVLIIGFTNGLVVCLTKSGRVLFSDIDGVKVIDKDYLDLLREKTND